MRRRPSVPDSREPGRSVTGPHGTVRSLARLPLSLLPLSLLPLSLLPEGVPAGPGASSGERRERSRHAAAVACAVVDGVALTALVAGAVLGVALMTLRAGAMASVGWVVALAAVGFTGAALWAALSADRTPGVVPESGWWATVLLLSASVAVTSGEVFVRLLVVLVSLALLGLVLAAVADPRGDGAPGERWVARRGPWGARQRDGA